MAKTDEKVMEMVEAELKKNPDATVDELYEKAKAINSGIGRLTNRQFHARYPLQVKRRKALGKGKKTSGRKASAKKSAPKKKTAAKEKAAPKKKTGGRKRGTSRRGRRAAASAPAAAPQGEGPGRDAVRDQFLRFATDLAAAEERKDVVKVLSGVDKYVDAVLKAAGS